MFGFSSTFLSKFEGADGLIFTVPLIIDLFNYYMSDIIVNLTSITVVYNTLFHDRLLHVIHV